MPTPPTLINLPPPPADPVTPSDIPGTPNSSTTTMSELSTVAIKDGHRGHLPHHRQPTQPEAERADRISRLAGLERVATARQPTPISALTPSASAQPLPNSGYFDASGNPTMGRERSTVGSASATGSVGGRTTWASGSDVFEGDKMSDTVSSVAQEGVPEEMDTSSVGGMSDEGASSLVGFGEGARTPARQSGPGVVGYGTASPGVAKGPSGTPTMARGPSMTPVNAQTAAEQHDARMIDGSTYDAGVVDTSDRVPGRTRGAPHTADRILKDRPADADPHGRTLDGHERRGTGTGQV